MDGQLTLVERFLNYLIVERHFSVKTYKVYEGDLIQLQVYLGGTTGSTVEPLMLSATEAQLKAYVKNLVSVGFSTATISRRIAAVRSFYKWLIKEKLIQSNPSLDLRYKTAEERVVKTATTEQLMVLLAMPDRSTLGGARDYAILQLICSTGIRTSELAALNLGDVSSTDGVASVIIRRKGRPDREIQLDPATFDAVKHYLLLLTQSGAMDSDEEAFLVNKHGTRLSTRSIRRRIAGYLSGSGLDEDISPFVLRHTYATRLARSGTSVTEIQEILGHRAQSTSAQTYFQKQT